MRWEVKWHTYAEDDIASLHPQARRRVLQAIAGVAEGRYSGLKKLRGSNRGDWRLRVGDWRAILTFDRQNNTFAVMRVQHRREVYRRR